MPRRPLLHGLLVLAFLLHARSALVAVLTLPVGVVCLAANAQLILQRGAAADTIAVSRLGRARR